MPTILQRITASDARWRLAVLLVLSSTAFSCQRQETPQVAIAHVAAAPSAPEARSPPRSTAIPADVRQLVDALAAEFPDDSSAFLARGRILYLYGQSDEALWCWDAGLEREPGSALAHEAIGHARFNRGEFHLAADHFREALERDASLDEARTQLGEALLQLGQHQAAIPVLEEQVRRRPKSSDAWILLGQACLGAEEYDRARASFQSAADLHSHSVRVWYGLSQAYDRLGQAEQARECRDRFLEMDGALTAADRRRRQEGAFGRDEENMLLAQAHCVAADLYARHGRFAEAQDHWRQAARLDPKNLACRQALGQSLVREGRFDEALNVYDELCERDPGNVQFVLATGALQQDLGQTEQAQATFRKALETHPEHPGPLVALASLYLATGRELSEARRLAERAIHLQPTAENFYLLSSTCRATQDLGGARAAIREAVRLAPDNPRYAAAARTLLPE